MDKHYDPARIEEKWYTRWKDEGVFRGHESAPGQEAYCIVIPPPNVTGILHMGHALNNTIQDVLIRWQRMAGRNVSWVPGTDHASIATEGKVVKMLAEQGIRKDDIGRDAFMEHAWAWKEKYGGIIINQLERLGCSCDWDRLRFTMDDDYTRAVYEAFVRLYHKGLIYRGKRLVNWCPASRSAISDEEVMYKDVSGHLWHFRYPVTGSEEVIVVATTRPETMLGDTAVAVHPEDERYRHLVGQTVMLPLVNREIPIIADTLVDPEFGTGCVKVTPAHDPNDFEMGQRHDLELINIMNEDASMNDAVPEAYRGLPREKARKAVVADLEAQGFLEKTEAYRNSVGYSQRGDVPIEYYLSEQWFMHMQGLAQPALDAVLDGRVRIHPEHWVKTYQHWMENIRDWCISRQLWWGQRIPVWYRRGADRNDPESRHVSVDGPPDPENWEQDPDVLDTWASSWLWPFAVHGWPEETPDLKTYYPTHALVTGSDILFFWVARMIMAGMEFMGEPPFSDVYIHGIVRDEHRRKMSKSLGNSIDPLTVIDDYSADALRFTLMMVTGIGQDISLSTEQFEVGRNFGTKLWNACRFIRQTGDGRPRLEGSIGDACVLPEFDPAKMTPDDAHILSGLWTTGGQCAANLEKFRFNDVVQGLYAFFWHEFCDWYIETCKPALDDPDRREHVLSVLHYVMAALLRLLHPVMPFLTEEIWHEMGYARDDRSISLMPWPEIPKEAARESIGVSEADVAYVEEKHNLIRSSRNLRADYNIPAGSKIPFIVRAVDTSTAEKLRGDSESMTRLSNASAITVDVNPDVANGTPSAITRLGTLYMPLEGVVDLEAETSRLEGKLDQVMSDLGKTAAKLQNRQFVSRAPAEVVARQRERQAELLQDKDKLTRMLEALQAG